ncbi:hypothetical protein ACFX1S_039937 [Malus domestica]
MMMMMLKAQNFRQRSGLKMKIVFAVDAVGGETIRAESTAGIAFELAIFLGRGGDENERVLGVRLVLYLSGKLEAQAQVVEVKLALGLAAFPNMDLLRHCIFRPPQPQVLDHATPSTPPSSA